MPHSINIFFADTNLVQEAQYVPGVVSSVPTKSTTALNVQVAGTTDNALRNGAADNTNFAASWAQSEESAIRWVYLRLKRTGTIAANKKVFVQLVTDNSGVPNTKVLGTSARVAADTMSTSYAWVKFTFPQWVTVSEGTTYHIVLHGDYDASSSNHVKWRSKTVASGGNQKVYDASWASVATEDFEIYASIPVIYQSKFEPIQVGEVEAYADAPRAVCKYADVADADNSTQITIDGTLYYVLEAQNDGTGIMTLILSEEE